VNEPDCEVLSLWSWLVGRIWKSLDKLTRESLECYNQSLMGHSVGNSQNQNPNKNAES
jgi:hypothetical protein